MWTRLEGLRPGVELSVKERYKVMSSALWFLHSLLDPPTQPRIVNEGERSLKALEMSCKALEIYLWRSIVETSVEWGRKQAFDPFHDRWHV